MFLKHFKRAIKSSTNNKVYVVSYDDGVWTCSCKAYEFGIRKDTLYECKHIIKIKMQLDYERANAK